jgi:ankyrin repeat protein
MSRSPCYGSCQSYSIELKGDGTAVYSGGQNVLVTGEHRFAISPDAVQCLLEHFRAADFWSLNDKYVSPITDSPTYELTLIVGSDKKSLIDYVGRQVGMPGAVTALESEIDQIGANRWVRGDAETIPSLRNENFDFHSEAAGTLLARAVMSAPDGVILDLLAEGAPATGRNLSRGPFGPTAIEEASLLGRLKIIRVLASAGAFSSGYPGEKEDALRMAVTSGNPEVVAELLSYGPDVNHHQQGQVTALNEIGFIQYITNDEAKSKEIEITKLLLRAGADPNITDMDGNSPLHMANSAELVQLLIKAGAKIDARNRKGETPLLDAMDDGAAVALITAGADTTAQATDGTTAESHAKQFDFEKAFALLQARKARQ